MKKDLVLILLLILGILFIISCSGYGTICGNGICEKTESCACDDCKNTDFCTVQNVTQECDDGNDCTMDSFNPSTNVCVHEPKANCCGNKKCEGNEYTCDMSTYQTVCPSDCGYSCPAKLIVQATRGTNVADQLSYFCGDQNCEKAGPNQFRMKGVSTIKTIVTNIGERTSDTITSSFSCTLASESTKIAINDNEVYYGTIFHDYFNDNVNDNLEKVDGINSRINPNNYATYNFKINITQPISPKDIKCTLVLSSSLYLQNIQQVAITIY